MGRFKVGVAQTRFSTSDRGATLHTLEIYARAAGEIGVRCLCFPEFFLTGFTSGPGAYRLAEPIPGPWVDDLEAISRENGVMIVAGMIELDVSLFNTSILVGPTGLIGKYRKTHLWLDERHLLKPGDLLPVFDTPLGRVGMAICYDMEFPETARVLALKGAYIIFYPSADMVPYENKHDVYTRARAVDNGVFVVNSNPVGINEDSIYFGRSQIVSPSGEVLAKAGSSEALIAAEIDPSWTLKEEEPTGYLKDRRPSAFYFREL